MTEIFVVIAIILIGAFVGVLSARKSDQRYQDISRRLLSLEHKIHLSRNYIGMSQITPHGPKDRDDYIRMADTEMHDALKEVRTLKKEIY